MGTLGCINDMLQRDKENRALRQRSRERMSETRNRLLEIGKETDYTNLSVEQLEDIRRKTLEKEKLDKAVYFKTMLYLALGMALILLLGWLLVGCNGKPSGNNQSVPKSDSASVTQGAQTISIHAQDTICQLPVATQGVKDSVFTEQALQKSPSVKWGHLVDETEGATKVCLNAQTHQTIKSKSEDVRIISSSLSKDKVYVSIFSTKHPLIYKGEYIFYREDKQGNLDKIHCKNTFKESVGLLVERGKAAEIGIDLPKNAQPGDYLLKIRFYDEDDTCFYNIYQWFEAYTSRQISTRKRPIPIGPAHDSSKRSIPNDEDVFDVVQHMPEFPGGIPKLMEFIRQNIEYPEAAKQGKLEGTVVMQVVIDKDGTVTQPQILRSVNPVSDADAALCEEALRIVSIMPKWKPGHQHGVNLKVRRAFPIKFEIK